MEIDLSNSDIALGSVKNQQAADQSAQSYVDAAETVLKAQAASTPASQVSQKNKLRESSDYT